MRLQQFTHIYIIFTLAVTQWFFLKKGKLNKAYLVAISIQKSTVISPHSVRNSMVSCFYQFPLTEPENAWAFSLFYAQPYLLSQLHLPEEIKYNQVRQEQFNLNRRQTFFITYCLQTYKIKMLALTFVVSFLFDKSVPKKKEQNWILSFKSFATQLKTTNFFWTLSTLLKQHRMSENI